MSDSEDTAQLLDSKPSDFDTSILNAHNVKPFRNAFNLNKGSLFIPNARNHIFEPFTPVQSYLCASVSILAGLAFGFDMTIGSNLLLSLGSILDLNCFEHRMLINGWIAGAIIAAFFSGIIIDCCGRRGCILGSSLILSASSLLGVSSGAYLIPFVPRFVSGCAACTLVLCQCVYICEMCGSERRGRCSVLPQVALQVGVLLSAVVGLQNTSNQESQLFYVVTGMICVFGVTIFFVTYVFLPESPHFVVSQEKRSSLAEQQHLGKRETSCLKGVAWPLLISVSLVLLVQSCGRSWVHFYAPRVFTLTGICTSIADSTTALTMSIIRILSANILLYTVNRLGVRACVLTSLAMMTVAAGLLSALAAVDEAHSAHRPLTPGDRVCNVLPVYSSIGMLPLKQQTQFKLSDFKTVITGDTTPPPFPLLPTPIALHQSRYENDNNPLKCPQEELLVGADLPPSFRMGGVIMLLTYEAGYTLGFGSLGWLLICELFPTKWRARGLGIAMGLFYILDLVTQMVFLKFTLPLCGLFMVFSVTCGVTFIVCFALLPNTRNKTLSEIQNYLNERHSMWCAHLSSVCCGAQASFPPTQSAHI